MRTIAIASEKGGVGKTTIAINLSAALAKEGHRVLTIDMDPQGFCAVAVAVPDDRIERSIHHCLTDAPNTDRVDITRITWQITPNLDLAPANRSLADLETSPPTDPDPLARALEEVNHRYDFCVIDCPAYTGVLTRLALEAADEIIVPVETGYFSLHALARHIETFERLASHNNTKTTVRALANQYDVRTKAAREILAELRRKFENVMLDAVINFNTKLKESASVGQPIAEFAPGSMGARDFQTLAREISAAVPSKEAEREAIDAFAKRLAQDANRVLATQVPIIKPSLKPTPQTTPTPIPQPAIEPVAPENERIDAKLEAIYGANPTPDGVVFRTLSPDANVVQLAGDFNDWMPHTTPMRRDEKSGVFETTLKLPPGRYRYRLVIDGRWAYDRDNPNVETSDYGEVHSVLEIK